MLIFGLGLSLLAIGGLCWLLFTLATLALPVFAGLTVARIALRCGVGVLWSMAMGIAAAGVLVGLARVAATRVRSQRIRLALAIIYAAPAAVAGYSVALALSHLAAPPGAQQPFIAVLGGGVVGLTAFARLLATPPMHPGASAHIETSAFPATRSGQA